MPDVTDEAEVSQEKQDQVLKREGLEAELMEQDRSEDAESLAAVEEGEEPA